MTKPTNVFVSIAVVVLLACGTLCDSVVSAFQTGVVVAGGSVQFSRTVPVPVPIPSTTAIRMSGDDEDTTDGAADGVVVSSEVSYQPPPNVVSNNAIAEAAGYPAFILSQNFDAADPSYKANGPLGGDDFVVSRTGGPTAEELASENLIRIVDRRSNVTDLSVCTLVWKCLGYRFDESEGAWKTTAEVFPKWKETYPEDTPPDVVGMQRYYEKQIDKPSFNANRKIHTSVPLEFKQSLKTLLKPYGFNGYKLSELTPNLTRRAQCTNWLIYYREQLFGYTMEELSERREKQQEQQSAS